MKENTHSQPVRLPVVHTNLRQQWLFWSTTSN